MLQGRAQASQAVTYAIEPTVMFPRTPIYVPYHSQVLYRPHVARGAGARLEHGQVGEREVAEAGDVEERDLVRALGKVPLRQLHRLAQVAHLRAARRARAGERG